MLLREIGRERLVGKESTGTGETESTHSIEKERHSCSFDMLPGRSAERAESTDMHICMYVSLSLSMYVCIATSETVAEADGRRHDLANFKVNVV
jgi:hypothetical protein